MPPAMARNMRENPVAKRVRPLGLPPVRDRREVFISTVTPVVATVLVAIAMVAVGLRNWGGSPPPAAAPPPVVATSLVVAVPTTTDDSGLPANAVAAVDKLRVGGVAYGVAILDR